jgi:hypothetical protein
MPDLNELPLSRAELERVIDALITMLDEIDPDPDLEDNGDTEPNGDEDEPSLGSLDRQSQERWSSGANATTWDLDRELDTADDEPSLGSTGNENQLLSWGICRGTTDDRERTGYTS